LLQRERHEPRDQHDALVDTVVIEDTALGSSHRLFVNVQPEGGSGEPLQLEVDVPAHPYEHLGVSTRAQWRVLLMSEHMTLVPREDT
jgi:hypothetical protein